MRALLPIAVAVVVALVAAGSWGWQRRQTESAGEQRSGAKGQRAAATPLEVDVQELASEPYEAIIPATGTLLARESVEIVSELNRRLVRIHAKEGARVKKGALMFELDRADLDAELGRLQVQIRLATTNSERMKALHAGGMASQQELEQSQAELDNLEAQRKVLAVTSSKTKLLAPFAGTLGLRRVSEGAWVSPNTVLATLHDTTTLKLDFTLPERYAGFVRLGLEFRFQVAGQSQPLKGKVLALEPAVSELSRSVVVRGEVANATDLMPGAFATVQLPTRVEQALFVPNIAVIPGADGRRVFLVRDGVARAKLVELGERSESRAQVLSGVAAGDQLIVSNLLRVRDGAPVVIKGRTPRRNGAGSPVSQQ